MKKFVIFCLIIILICPVSFGVGMFLSQFMPHCQVGSGGPAAGCVLMGVSINWFMQYSVVLGFLGSFFLVPIGIVLLVIGCIVSALSSRSKAK